MALTGVGLRSKKSLLLTSENDEFDISVELDAFTTDGACNGEERNRTGPIVVPSWGLKADVKMIMIRKLEAWTVLTL